jgi:CheY-like chemotaxis protein
MVEAKQRILVVDDTLENTDLVARVLGDQIDISVAASGEGRCEAPCLIHLI